MDRALVSQTDVEQAFYQTQLLIAVNRWAYSYGEDGNREANQVEIMDAWCKWRSVAEALHRARERRDGQRLGLPPQLLGMPRLEDLFDDKH